VVIRLNKSGVEIAEIGLQQPTLNDVFLAITGHTADKDEKKKTS
jgi:hypothetical protein